MVAPSDMMDGRVAAIREALDEGGLMTTPIMSYAVKEIFYTLQGEGRQTGRAGDDPATAERMLALVDEIGLSTLADLWASRPPRSLPGALWRLYFIREWMRTDAAGVGRV